MEESIKNIDYEEIKHEIIKFNNDPNISSLKMMYNEKSFLDILGVSRRELCHSYFLYWLLSPNESHGLQYIPIKKFLELLLLSKFWYKYDSVLNTDDIITGNYRIKCITIEREKTLEDKSRIDLLLCLKIEYGNSKITNLRVIIENKVLSSENNDQTNKYYSYFEKNKDDYQNIYVYLTPISSMDLEELTRPECENENFIQINYQALVDYLLEPILQIDLTVKTKFFIDQYIQTLSQPTFQEDDEDYEKGLIMAINERERELLIKFWDGHKKIIMAALYAIGSDPNQEKDLVDYVSTAVENLTSTGKDRSKINIYLDEKIVVKEIQKSDLGYSTVKLLNDRKLIDPTIFTWMKNDMSCSFKLIKEKKDVRETEAKYRKYRINKKADVVIFNKEFYVARNWGINNIYKLIETIEKKFNDRIKYEIVDAT